MSGKSNAPIIIKKIEEDGHHGHHGGGWKVAYADFMTAMMAFFLLLWILAASDEEKLRGLADYFTPSLSESGGKGHGLLDGIVLGPEGVMSGTDGPKSEVQLPSFGQENPLSVFDSRLRDEEPETVVEYEPAPAPGPEDRPSDTAGLDEPSDLEAALADALEAEAANGAATAAAAEMARLAEQQAAEFEAVEQQIEEALGTPQMQDLARNVLLERTPEGLRVQIVDQEGRSMFARGSARIESATRELIRIVGQAIADLPNDIVIAGHTDAVPFTRNSGYDNWELSSDRAHATRRMLLAAGVNPSRITRVSGLADTEPLEPSDPNAAVNRRISVLLEYPEALKAHLLTR